MVGSRSMEFIAFFHRHLFKGSVPPASAGSSKIATLRSHPILFTTTFCGLYKSLVVLSYIPPYYFHFTDSSTAFLVGPYVTSLLRKPLPFSRAGRTVEDVLDTSINRFMEVGSHVWSKYEGWKADERKGENIVTSALDKFDAKKKGWEDTAQYLKSHLAVVKDHAVALQAEPRFWRKWSERRGDDKQGKGDVIARDASEDLQANGSWRETAQALSNHPAALKAIAVKAGLGELNVDKLREWKDQAMKSLPAFDEVVAPKSGRMKALTDSTAAYVAGKVLVIPLRLAASLLLTPKVARLLDRHWKEIFRK